MPRDSIPRPLHYSILLCFFLSGAAGLVYQVAWSKALGLIFGNTVYAIATVLAVFMGGLALGSALIGRWCKRAANGVALYGGLELGVAASGALSLAGLAGVRWLYFALHPVVAAWTPGLVALRFMGAALVLFLPTFLMGGTFPVLVKGLARTSAELGARVSRLYWVNTLGAVAGTFAAGFALLPALGLRRTVGVAVALNIAAGIISLLAARARVFASPAEAAPEAAGAAAPSFDEWPAPARQAEASPRWLLAGFALVGGTAIAYEICWTRLLATILGSSTYAFTLMLGTFLAGIVLGSALFEIADRRWMTRGRAPSLAAFAATQTLTALAALGFLVFFQKFSELVPLILRSDAESFRRLVLAQFVTSALAMLPAAVVFGFNFPLVTLLIAGRPESGRGLSERGARHAAAVGRAYAANTLGAILAALAVGFWLVPAAGSFRMVGVAAACNLLLAALLSLKSRAPRAKWVFAANALLAVAVAGVAISGALYDPQLATFATVIYWDRYQESHLTVPEMAATTDVVFVRDGLNATISVARTEDYLAVRTNGKVDASNNDRVTQLLVGHIPALFHPAPKSALIVGFGSGMTVSAVARHSDVERIVCVEIEPGVMEAAKFLTPLNRNVLADPLVQVVIDDARNFLLTTRQRFDLIISEPSNPWIAGVSALYTDEFYRQARSRLNPGGIFIQWVQAYSLYPEDFRMILATFVPHFRQVTLWRGESPDYLLIGQLDASPLSLGRLRRLWAQREFREDLEQVGMRRPEGLLAFHRLDDADVRRFAAAGPRNTDDRNLLEYRAPLALLASGLERRNSMVIWQHRSTPLSANVRVEDEQAALIAAAETLVELEDTDADHFLNRLSAVRGAALLELVRGRWALAQSSLPAAREAFTRALALDPNSLDAAWGLGEAARKTLTQQTAELMFRQVLARDPNHVPALRSMGSLQRGREDWAEALALQERLLKALPRPDARELARLGELRMETHQPELAARAFLAALEADPYSYAAHRNLGEYHKNRKEWERARLHLEFVARFHPDLDPATYVSLAEIYRALGRPSDAISALRKGNRIFPGRKEILRLLPVTN